LILSSSLHFSNMDGPTMTDFCSWACADQNRKTSAPYAGSFDWSLKKKNHQCLNINGNKQPAFLQSFAIFCSFIGLQKLTEVHFVWSTTAFHIKYILLSTLLQSYKTTKLGPIKRTSIWGRCFTILVSTSSTTKICHGWSIHIRKMQWRTF
jgi:hypothetical protein